MRPLADIIRAFAPCPVPRPSGTATFLFTDIEGSTALLQRLGDRRSGETFETHRRLLRSAFQQWHGYEIEIQGDGFLVAFQSARDAVLAALAAQGAIAAHCWADGAVVRVRMGLHTAEVSQSGGAYVGLGLHRAARICSVGWGGQVLLSWTTADVLENHLPEGTSLLDLGKHRLKDLERPKGIFQLVHPVLRVEFPPIRSLGWLSRPELVVRDQGAQDAHADGRSFHGPYRVALN